MTTQLRRGSQLARRPRANARLPTNRDSPSPILFPTVVGLEYCGEAEPGQRPPQTRAGGPHWFHSYRVILEGEIDLAAGNNPQSITHRLRDDDLAFRPNTVSHTHKYNSEIVVVAPEPADRPPRKRTTTKPRRRAPIRYTDSAIAMWVRAAVPDGSASAVTDKVCPVCVEPICRRRRPIRLIWRDSAMPSLCVPRVQIGCRALPLPGDQIVIDAHGAVVA